MKLVATLATPEVSPDWRRGPPSVEAEVQGPPSIEAEARGPPSTGAEVQSPPFSKAGAEVWEGLDAPTSEWRDRHTRLKASLAERLTRGHSIPERNPQEDLEAYCQTLRSREQDISEREKELARREKEMELCVAVEIHERSQEPRSCQKNDFTL